MIIKYKKIYNLADSFPVMVQNTREIKDKIVSFLRMKGPSLPVHIAGQIESDILFSSAFLAELVSEKKVKISHMRVGSSPLYFLPGQEFMLERFSPNLKSREKDAFVLLKEKKFLQDSEQQPAIRVALREIRDFAIPFKAEDAIIWRYFLIPEEEFRKPVKIPETKEETKEEKEKLLGIFDEVKEEKKEKIKPKIPKKTKGTAKRKSTKDEKFFMTVKEFLSKKNLELLDIENFGKKEIILRISDQGEEKLLVACNKSKISEIDILKANKKASELKLPYIVLGIGGPLKKLENLLEALVNLSSVEKLK